MEVVVIRVVGVEAVKDRMVEVGLKDEVVPGSDGDPVGELVIELNIGPV
jgi:hypothetical protein